MLPLEACSSDNDDDQSMRSYDTYLKANLSEFDRPFWRKGRTFATVPSTRDDLVLSSLC